MRTDPCTTAESDIVSSAAVHDASAEAPGADTARVTVWRAVDAAGAAFVPISPYDTVRASSAVTWSAASGSRGAPPLPYACKAAKTISAKASATGQKLET